MPEPAEWDKRLLPTPSVRLAWAAIADCRQIGARWQRMFKHLGVSDDQPLSVLAEGAKWIWEQAGKRLPGRHTQWCVDVYHVSEHLHACGKGMFGDTDAQSRAWAREQLRTLLDVGGIAFVKQLDQMIDGEPQPSHRQAI